jgi:ABC-type Fe3+ transport system permease subunit
MNADVVLPLVLLVAALVFLLRPRYWAARVHGSRRPGPDDLARQRGRDVCVVVAVASVVVLVAVVLLMLGLGESSTA